MICFFINVSLLIIYSPIILQIFTFVNSKELNFKELIAYNIDSNYIGGCLMTLTNAIRRRIKQLCDERGITINKLSTICGITQSTLNNIFTRENNKPTVSTVKKICDGLEITLVDFFNNECFYELDQEVK